MPAGTNGLVLTLAAAVLGVAFTFWAYQWFPRIHAWLFAIGTAITVVAIPVWLDALAGMTHKGTGLTVLSVAFVVGGLCFLVEAVVRHKHHEIRTPVIAGTFGIAFTVGMTNWRGLLANFGKAIRGVITEFGQAEHRVHSGHAAKALPPSQQHLIGIIALLAFAAIVVVGVLVRRSRGAAKQRKPLAIATGKVPFSGKPGKGKPGQGGGSRAALPAGRSPSRRPAPRPSGAGAR